MKILENELFNLLSIQAGHNPRLRQNFNLHQSYSEKSQRLLNALEPGSYIRPHRHLEDPKPECFIGLRGKFALLLFDDDGRVENAYHFGPNETIAGIDLPPGIWHTVVCMEKGSIFFETKPGPFIPTNSKDMAPWAPAENSPEANTYLTELMSIANSFVVKG